MTEMQPITRECRQTRDAASDYLDGYLRDSARPAFKGHLRTCSSCRGFMGELKVTVDLLAGLREQSPTNTARAECLRSFGEYFPEPDLPASLFDWTPSNQLWGELVKLPPEERIQAVKEEKRYGDPLLCDWLTGRARKLSSINPAAAVPIAEMAIEIAQRREDEPADSERLFYALDALAWCLEKRRDFAPMARTLSELNALRDTAELGPGADVRYLSVKGIYHSHIGEFEEGRRYLAQALELARLHGSRRDVLCHLVNLVGTLLTAGDTQAALTLGLEAEELLDVEQDSARLQLALYVNLMLAFCQDQQLSEARRSFRELRRLAAKVGGWYSSTSVIWSEGTLLWSEGRYGEAEERFELVRMQFLARGFLYWFVEASLDLARVHLQRGGFEDLAALAADLLARTEEMQADERVRSAAVHFAQAVRQRSLSEQVISSIAVALSSAKHSRRF